MGGGAAVLAVAGVIDHQHPLGVRRGRRVGHQQPDPLLVDGLVVPARLRQEPLQPLDLAVLGAHDRLGIGQPGQRLVPVAGRQQALEVVAQAAALRQARKQRVEVLGVVLQRAGSGWAGAASGHRRGGSWRRMAGEQSRGSLHQPQQTTDKSSFHNRDGCSGSASGSSVWAELSTFATYAGWSGGTPPMRFCLVLPPRSPSAINPGSTGWRRHGRWVAAAPPPLRRRLERLVRSRSRGPPWR